MRFGDYDGSRGARGSGIGETNGRREE